VLIDIEVKVKDADSAIKELENIRDIENHWKINILKKYINIFTDFLLPTQIRNITIMNPKTKKNGITLLNG